MEQWYQRPDSIFAPITGGTGAVAGVRISGALCQLIWDRLTAGAPYPEARKFVRRTIYTSRSAVLDDAMLVRFAAPNSYTGEEVLEIFHHANPLILEGIIEVASATGAKSALPGEFSYRAVLNGKMSLSQAEALPEIFEARHTLALSHALRKLSGNQDKVLGSISLQLQGILGRAELGIDFVEQEYSTEVEGLSLRALQAEASDCLSSVDQILRAAEKANSLRDGFRVVFVGLPNAGKSSVFNSILDEERALVSPTAGTTRDLVSEVHFVNGPFGKVLLRLEDTAGLRNLSLDEQQSSPHLALEFLGIKKTLARVAAADLLIWVVNPADGVLDLTTSEELLKNIRELIPPKAAVWTLFTHADVPGPNHAQELLVKLGALLSFKDGHRSFSVSNVARSGFSEFNYALGEYFSTGEFAWDEAEVVLTRAQSVAQLQRVREKLSEIRSVEALEILAVELRGALDYLEPLVGRVSTDDILNRVFREFCIGK